MLDNRKTERHEMILQDTHEGGAEEWYCPTCGRRFLMQWPPNFKRVVLECGDENAIHTGSKGGVYGQTANLGQDDETLLSDEWHSALGELDFGMTDASYDEDDYIGDVTGYEDPGLSDEMIAALEELDFSALDSLDGYEEKE